MKKALIKSTGEILDVTQEYSLMSIEFSFPIDFPEEISEKMKKDFSLTHEVTDNKYKMKTGKAREDYFELSNGETYESDDIVVGTDEIRNWKIKNNLDI